MATAGSAACDKDSVAVSFHRDPSHTHCRMQLLDLIRKAADPSCFHSATRLMIEFAATTDGWRDGLPDLEREQSAGSWRSVVQ